MKRISSIFLSVLFLLTALPLGEIPVFAAYYGSMTYTVSGGEVTITDYNPSVYGKLSIPSKIEGYPVTAIGERAFYNCTGLTSVTIPDSVTAIGESAFYNCAYLTSVTIPDRVTTIEVSAFEKCKYLTSVTIPNSVTAIVTYVFRDCVSLTSVTIPDSVTAIGFGAFLGCSNLTDVYYGGSPATKGEMSIGGYNTALTDATWHYACDGHEYDHDYDPSCNLCGAIRKVEEYIPGDADGDGKVITRDVALLQQYLADWDITLNEVFADADGDGKITTRDVALLQQYLAGWGVELG